MVFWVVSYRIWISNSAACTYYPRFAALASKTSRKNFKLQLNDDADRALHLSIEDLIFSLQPVDPIAFPPMP